MQGLSFGDYPFDELFAPLMPDFASLYWIADFQSNPFSWEWYSTNEARLEAMHIPNTSNCAFALWRPGLLPEVASPLMFGENSYLVGYSATDDTAMIFAEQYCNMDEKKYFEEIEKREAIYIRYIDGWWEVYSPRTDWLIELQEHLPASPANSDNYSAWNRPHA